MVTGMRMSGSAVMIDRATAVIEVRLPEVDTEMMETRRVGLKAVKRIMRAMTVMRMAATGQTPHTAVMRTRTGGDTVCV